MSKLATLTAFALLAGCTVQPAPQEPQPPPPAAGEEEAGEPAEEGEAVESEGPGEAEATAEASSGGQMPGFSCGGSENRMLSGATVTGDVEAHGS